jgi:hypothetical protein
MDPQRTVQKVFNSKPYGSRKIGRLKLKWEDGVLQDIRALDSKNWMDMAMRREEWQRLLWKATLGCQADDDDNCLFYSVPQ